MATAQNVRQVYDATKSCKTVEEIVEATGLTADVVQECIETLTEMNVITRDSDRVCNYEAVAALKNKFSRICELCI